MTGAPIVIFGSGAMACLLAARISSSGQKVYLVDDWAAGIQTIRENGITLQIDRQIIHQNVTTFLPGEPVPPAKFVLVLVKSWQTAATADRIYPFLDSDGMVLTLQNGLENDLILKRKLGQSRVIVGVTTLGATLKSPGIVIGFDQGTTVIQDRPGAQPLLSILKTARLKVTKDAAIDSIIWGKLVINAAINPLTAILGIPNGKLLDSPDSLELMEQIAAEGSQVAAKLGILLPYANPMQQITAAARATAQNYSSMFQDLQRGAPTEIDQINGAITRLGAQNGIPTPYNQSMIALIKSRVSLNNTR